MSFPLLQAISLLQNPPTAAFTPIGTLTPTTATGTTSSLSINVPSGVVNGDVLICIVGFSGGATAYSAPASTGWTAIGSAFTSSTFSECAFWRVASSEPASYTFSVSTGAPTNCAGAMIALTNTASSGQPESSSSANDATASTTHSSPSATPLAATDALVAAFAVNVAGTFSGLTAGWTLAQQVASSGEGVMLAFIAPNSTSAQQASVTVNFSSRSYNAIAVIKHA